MSDYKRADAKSDKFDEWLILFWPEEYSVHFEVTTWEEVSIDGGAFELNKDADTEVEGFIKWDGCSEWRMGDEVGYGFHCCGWDGLDKLNALFKRCYRLAQENCPNFDSPMACLPEDQGLPTFAAS